MVAPIPENLAKEGGLAWWTPYTQSMPKSRSAQWVSLAVYWVEKEGAMDREGREGREWVVSSRSNGLSSPMSISARTTSPPIESRKSVLTGTRTIFLNL